MLATLPKNEVITATQRASRGLALEDYGLRPPRARIVVGDSEKRHTLNLGAESPLKDAVYTQLDADDSVLATSTNLLEALPMSTADLRDTRLVQGAPSYIRRIEFKRSDGPLIQLIKNGADWLIQKPILARADLRKIAAWLDQLYAIRIRDFVSETLSDPVAYGLAEDDALLLIGLWQDDEKTNEKILFGRRATEKGDRLFAGKRGLTSVYTVMASDLDALITSVQDLRDSRIYFMPPETVSWIRLEEGEKALQLQKGRDHQWQIIEPKQWKADNRVVVDLIARLNTLRIESFVTPGTNIEFGLDRPARIIRMSEAPPPAAPPVGSTQTVETVAGPGRAGRVLLLSRPLPGVEYSFARFEDESQVCQVSASATATIPLDPIVYRDHTAIALDPTGIIKIVLLKEGREQAVERDAGGNWRALNPVTGMPEIGAIAESVARMTALRILRYEHGESSRLAAYGLKEPHASLTFGLRGGEGIQKTLLFGDRSEDLGVYAMLQGQEVVFVIDQSIAEALLRNITH